MERVVLDGSKAGGSENKKTKRGGLVYVSTGGSILVSGEVKVVLLPLRVIDCSQSRLL